jgi:hypothetical protein
VIRAWGNHTFLRRKPKENVLDIIAGCSVLKPDSMNGFAWGECYLEEWHLKGVVWVLWKLAF